MRAKWLRDVAAFQPADVAALALRNHVDADLRAFAEAPNGGLAFGRAVVKGLPVAAVSASADDKAPALRLLVRMLKDLLSDWLADLEAGGSEIPRVLALNSFVCEHDGARRDGMHGVAAAVDIGALDFTSADPAAVRDVVALAAKNGATHLGLPFQGALFPEAHRCGSAVTAPDERRLKYHRAHVWSKDCTAIKSAGGARSMLQDGALRTILADYPKLIVFPDYVDHVHVAMT